MRLIDADLFKGVMKCAMKDVGYSEEHINGQLGIIDLQPTAYDVDKVIEQLEYLDIHFDNDYFSSNNKEMLIREKVFEIVNTGGLETEK